MSREKKVAQQIIGMLSDRSGFDGFWLDIDDDIQEEIIDEIAGIVAEIDSFEPPTVNNEVV